MKLPQLGELEEWVLLMVCKLHPEAYGVNVRDELASQTGRDLTMATIHVALHRLEEKGFLKSFLSDPTAVRGGKSKRIFHTTAYGVKALRALQEKRTQIWGGIPAIVFRGS